ncbi:ribosomal protein L11 methyltransferase [Brevirhabdus pacifica]|uniref:Ribosomal protein L11 methyltransferase n=1 Tax=Brevirhabdus pacifica TaxID=1267768 RepID=A0A1U7DHE4_9RHOB|nr:50S ribosomal protein L11 methyltransferase [Brevirhabdus pacifica]APX89396.1 ribosomal protein L11 methyltransferase [Brevirhabdus pacifica]OWU76578.1 ribosomal protein L11 methyltransferase [Loktanella sp. 22II-4b]PJJ85965.1 [LSU ribosomal protein L11P]-lysine N-methyltransferase [Brevirhabdus pacifica]
MPTYNAVTTLPGAAAAQALGEALETMQPEPTGIGIFEVEDGSDQWEVTGYFLDSPDPAGLALIATMHAAPDFAVVEIPDTDWVAKVRRDLPPVEAGRFFVYGSHDAEKVPEGRVALLIEAALAFGTGHHGTTQGCLRALDRLLEQGFAANKVADIGCGTAVLAMGAARAWPGARILASDIDPVAIEVSETNLAANGMEGRVDCLVAPGFEHPDLDAVAPYDLIFANILKGPLLELAPEVAGRTAPGCRVILSGLLNEQAPEIIAAYSAEGLDLEHHEEIGEWSSLTLHRPA